MEILVKFGFPEYDNERNTFLHADMLSPEQQGIPRI